ncbi:MAG: DUF2264 domain-containing protein [Propionibacteriaceae bacterium]|nr:DUF2264 domain-containing protein [Propionibacteriaceae bacterium]
MGTTTTRTGLIDETAGDGRTPTRRARLGPASLPDDRTLSPYTGWTRDHWVALATQLLDAARRHGSDNHARIHIPGEEGGYGHDVDGLEGFARTLLAAGFLAAGSEGAHLDPLEWYAEGFRHGPNPLLDPSRRWVRPTEHDQAKVEAASLALVLWLTRPHLWDALSASTREMTVDYLAEWIHASYPKNNWVWFRLITEQFLKSVGGPWSRDDQEEDLAFQETCYAGQGWYRDGSERAFDHYNGWAFHVYPLLWCDMAPDDPDSVRLRPVFQARLDQYLADAQRMVGADGGMLAQGRSLIYRFASAAPLWMAAISGSTALPLGLARRAASGLTKNFTTHGTPDEQGLLSMGWYGPWRALAQSYSGPGSPYWASSGLLGLILPASHPVWTVTEEPLPVEVGDQVSACQAPGWLVSATRADGIVRVVNHGTDHALPDSGRADSPLYAHLGYSTATFPLLDADSWAAPVTQSVSLIDSRGRASHRSGFLALGTSVSTDGRTGIAASHAHPHWVDPDPVQTHHGSGLVGDSTWAGEMTVVSVVRGPWEVRAIHVDEASTRAERLRVGGWAMTGEQMVSTTSSDTVDGFACVETDTLVSSVGTLSSQARGGIQFHWDASPLGASSAVPYLDFPVRTGTWVSVLITLSGQVSPIAFSAGEKARTAADIHSTGSSIRAHIVWPDGVDTDSTLPVSFTTGRDDNQPHQRSNRNLK